MQTLSLTVASYLANAIWEVTLVAVAAELADRLLRRAPSRYRHVLWIIALGIAVLIPFLSLTAPNAKPVAAAPESGSARSAGLLQSPSMRTTEKPEATSRTTEGQRQAPLRLKFSPGWSFPVTPFFADTLFLIYVALILLRVWKLMRAWRETRQLLAAAQAPELPHPIAVVLAQCASALGFANIAGFQAPRFLFSKAINLPATVGTRHPAILLPENILETADSSELAAAISHELVHVRRRDYLLNLFTEILMVPIWFHPAAAYIKRRIGHTRELASDELAAAGHESHASYALALVSITRRLGTPSSLSRRIPRYSLGLLETDNLEERIMKLTHGTSPMSKRLVRLSIGLALTLLATPCLAATLFSLVPNLQQSSTQTSKPGTNEVNDRSIAGVVEDPSGARVPNALVTLTYLGKPSGQGFEVEHKLGEAERFRKKVAANGNGEYTFTGLPEKGVYLLEADSPGFTHGFVQAVVDTTVQQAEVKAKGYAYLAKQSSLGITLDLADLTPLAEAVVVKAKAPQGISTTREVSAPKRIRLGGLVQQAKLTYAPQPDYPEAARAKGIEGEVVLEVVISLEGVPYSFELLNSSDPALGDAALKAVRQWRYKPTLLNGAPVEVVTDITVRFELEH